MIRSQFTCLLTMLLLSAPSQQAPADDWPQILGPSRNGVATGEKLLASWPATGPRVAWKQAVGSGFAGVAIASNRVIVFHRQDDSEQVQAMDAATGKLLWKTGFDAHYKGGVNADLGPRCVPLVHKGHVYVYGAAGDLHCLRLEDGTKTWSRATYEDFDGDEGYFGAGATPIVAGGKLLVNVGGAGNAGLVAFDLLTGKTLWQATAEAASYSSPTLAMIGGREHAVFVTRMNVMAVDPGNGKMAFQFPFGRRGPTVNAATPLVIGNKLFVTASYQIGARTVQFGPDSTLTDLWASDNVMSSQYSTAVHHQGFLYGFHGREDIGTGSLRCVELKTGALKWSQDRMPVGHVITSGDLLLVLSVEGGLSLVRASPAKYERLAQADIAGGT
ncbi:MAG: PQQ-like beta-propeller repeat protein, partial [Pirellulaceae bacterium]|nr:PQQ-like beta-propeller repeat protein [Pirellulaceae bacterium]